MPKQRQDVPEDFTEYEQILARSIGQRIKQRRKNLNLSQENVRAKMELASVYITRTQFSRIESGKSLPKASEIIALTFALQVPCSWLLLGDEDNPKR